MARSILWVAGLLLAAASAGCLGGGGDADVDSVGGSSTTGTGNGTISANVTMGPGNGTTADAEGNLTWTHDNRTGTVSGNGAPLVGGPFEEEESFAVLNGTELLYVNVTVEGDDVTLLLRAPDCADDACAEEAQTSGGDASIRVMSPMEGPWVAVVRLTGTGPVEADYTLHISQLAPEASA